MFWHNKLECLSTSNTGAMTLTIKTFSIKTFSIKTFSLKTLSIKTFSLKTLSIIKPSIKGLFVPLSKNDTQRNNTLSLY